MSFLFINLKDDHLFLTQLSWIQNHLGDAHRNKNDADCISFDLFKFDASNIEIKKFQLSNFKFHLKIGSQ